jgi:flagellar protein FlaG
MNFLTISREVVLPANLRVIAARDGSGKPAHESSQSPEQSETASHEPVVPEAKKPIDLVINGQGIGLRFYQDREAAVRVIQVIDEASGDVIRQIPSEEVVHFMRQFQETKGHFVSRHY